MNEMQFQNVLRNIAALALVQELQQAVQGPRGDHRQDTRLLGQRRTQSAFRHVRHQRLRQELHSRQSGYASMPIMTFVVVYFPNTEGARKFC